MMSVAITLYVLTIEFFTKFLARPGYGRGRFHRPPVGGTAFRQALSPLPRGD